MPDFAKMAADSSDAQLLHMLEATPDEWSVDALDAARAELGKRGVTWTEKEPEPDDTASPMMAFIFMGIGVLAFVAVVGTVWAGVRVRFIIKVLLVVALLGGFGYHIPRRLH